MCYCTIVPLCSRVVCSCLGFCNSTITLMCIGVIKLLCVSIIVFMCSGVIVLTTLLYYNAIV